ncbi:hypothetical protein [Alteromonas macleodii]|uniref:Uncharacterized protein n=1 Tax=Alteromonas macleodii TaxID=28108 RepID=A0AB36G4V2_ALTMA|nr:hypothetical protein [Alteromonas macleodii]OES37689.1 hypothetical protein BFV94_0257 [Alteromonas macleodii]OES37926.1 hypothetical protein BFV93_0255 [Alteromonas macleodii]OES38298.1 hypothetical protein BFV95_0254 [Alteromonas macleodii]OES43148.1 hypothetical protein BFV96_0256 [Alteromonas macleodii]HAA97368.1 hypothetical protein [Alteromonas macleodii]|tara:strand:- start:839 stop:1990 length:1152 start_codon:yes stop_codon:yes gene_type:complete
MTKISANLKQFFCEGKLFVNGDFLTSKELEEEKFKQLFSSINHQSYHFDVNSNVGTVSVEELDFIYEDFHDLLESALSYNEGAYPDEVIILSAGNSFVKVDDFMKNINGWFEFFRMTADHFFSNDREERSFSYVFIDHRSNKSSTVVTFNPADICSSVIEGLVDSITDPSKLLKSLNKNDAHKGEKLSTMRVSIIDMVKNNGLCFVDFLEFGEELLNKFHINYETYLKSFSFEDFVKDLEEDVGDFINKVEEQIQGFYMQALAVPGAVILASALRGAEKSVSLALIFSASLALLLVFRSLISKKKFIKRIAENTQTKLQLYKSRTADINNNFAKSIISEKIEAAMTSVTETEKDSIKDIRNLRDIIISVIAMYLICATVFWKF